MAADSEFGDLDDWLAPPAKQLTIKGKTYSFPDRLDAETGATLLRLRTAARADPDEDSGKAIERIVGPESAVRMQAALFGPTAEAEMRADGVIGDQIERVMQTLIAWHMEGTRAALLVWKLPPGGATPPNREARRAASKATARKAPRASTSGTKPPAAKKAAKAPASRGRRSSSAGTT